jgi:hypothetical protein
MNPADPEDRSVASFVRGLTIGALIGAISAGSSMWTRRRRRRAGERQAKGRSGRTGQQDRHGRQSRHVSPPA